MKTPQKVKKIIKKKKKKPESVSQCFHEIGFLFKAVASFSSSLTSPSTYDRQKL